MGRPAGNRLRWLAPRQNCRTQCHRRTHASRHQRSPSLPRPRTPILLCIGRRTDPRSRTSELPPSPWRRTRDLPRPAPSGNESKPQARAHPRHQPTPKPRRQNHRVVTGNRQPGGPSSFVSQQESGIAHLLSFANRRPGGPLSFVQPQNRVAHPLRSHRKGWVIRVSEPLSSKLSPCPKASSDISRLETCTSSPSAATATPTSWEPPPPATPSSKPSKKLGRNTASKSSVTFSCRTTSTFLVTEPEGTNLSTALQVIKQRFSRTRSEEFVWEPCYHGFNAFTEAKKIEKLRYMHRNPVKAGLVEEPDQWHWSSFRVYANQEDHPILIRTR
jgi:hypothetical protein